ncbi:hypothetical protein lerEdw1_007308 [Lerista edwardsae]|nr:hypothetical protein lerEdw1_007308 [Lerista edwardsae]
MIAPCSALQFLLATTLQVLYGAATMLQPQENGAHPSGEGILGRTSPGQNICFPLRSLVQSAPSLVIRWMDVYNRSFCQPKETMVPVSDEHPGEVEHVLVPSCVSLRRCAGCCADEELQCVPVQMHVVIMEVMKTRFPRSQLGQMPFVEHSACECRPKKLINDKTDR